jgi:hypothetical protein
MPGYSDLQQGAPQRDAQTLYRNLPACRTCPLRYDQGVSDHAILGLLLVVAIAIGVVGLLIATSMLRECQRLTRAVAALVYQEGERTRAIITGRPTG